MSQRQSEAWRLKQRLDATFERIRSEDIESIELQADFAKYLCVLISGYLERSIIEIVQEHARQNGSLTLARFVEAKTKRFTNARPQKIKELLDSFDQEWGREIEGFLNAGMGESVSTIISNRHQIAHGFSSDITISQVQNHYKDIQKIVDKVQRICIDIDGLS